MLFFGANFFSGQQSITATDMHDVTDIEVQNGKFDNLFVTKNADATTTSDTLKWDYNTVLYAMFNGTLLAGNLNTALDTISAVLIKQREYGSYNWQTVYEIPISQAKDFQFGKAYRYCKGNETQYEFALVPIINGTEGEYFINDVVSSFDGCYLTEKDLSYQMLANIKIAPQYNRPTGLVTTLGRKKPYIVSNGDAEYYSGTIETTFIVKTDDGTIIDFESSTKYRDEINKFLHNGRPKVLKHFDGRVWLISITDAITEDISGHWKAPITTINWVETGELDDEYDMYENDLLDYYPS